MAFKLVSFAALLAVARAGIPLGYASAPAVSYSSIASPVAHYAPAAYAAPAIAKVATYASPAYSYAAPVAKYASYAPAVQYAAPALSYAHAPVSYAHAPVSYAPIAKTIVAEPSTPAHYDFGYSVSDPHTGDSKSQQESRRGDVVQGSYSLIEADGTKRIVEYTADAHNGFNAVVHKEPAAVAVKAAVPVAYAAPVARYASPLAYAAPVAKIATPLTYAAPAYAKIAAPALSYASPAYTYHH